MCLLPAMHQTTCGHVLQKTRGRARHHCHFSRSSPLLLGCGRHGLWRAQLSIAARLAGDGSRGRSEGGASRKRPAAPPPSTASISARSMKCQVVARNCKNAKCNPKTPPPPTHSVLSPPHPLSWLPQAGPGLASTASRVWPSPPWPPRTRQSNRPPALVAPEIPLNSRLRWKLTDLGPNPAKVRPKSVSMLGRLRPKSYQLKLVQIWPDFADVNQSRTKLNKVWPSSANSGKSWPNLYQVRPKSAEFNQI